MKADRADEEFRKLILGTLGALEMTKEDLAKVLGISYSTLMRRMKAPKNFTRGDEQIVRRLAARATNMMGG